MSLRHITSRNWRQFVTRATSFLSPKMRHFAKKSVTAPKFLHQSDAFVRMHAHVIPAEFHIFVLKFVFPAHNEQPNLEP